MKNKLKITRCNFPNNSMLYWFTYFISVLENEYEVIIDSENPDIVFYSNMYFSTNEIDLATNRLAKSHDFYGKNVKKIFCSGEMVSSHMDIISSGENYFAIGPHPCDHPRYLRMQLHNTTSAWGLFHESKLVPHPYNWLTSQRNGQEILQNKKHFCGVVQNSSIPYRVELFNELSKYKFVRASGGWITNVPSDEVTIQYPVIDGEGYKSKVEFLSSCKFSIQVQSSNLPYFTHEKMIHAFAAKTIPIFFGNDKILEDGFNPESFINCHDYESMSDIVDKIKEIDNNDEMFKYMITQPYFQNNLLPEYFHPDYILSFIKKVLKN